MCRPTFISTLAALLSGTHMVGPLTIDGLPTDARCHAPPRESSPVASAIPAPACCR